MSTNAQLENLKLELQTTYDDWEGCDYDDLQHYYRSRVKALKAQIAELGAA